MCVCVCVCVSVSVSVSLSVCAPGVDPSQSIPGSSRPLRLIVLPRRAPEETVSASQQVTHTTRPLLTAQAVQDYNFVYDFYNDHRNKGREREDAYNARRGTTSQPSAMW